MLRATMSNLVEVIIQDFVININNYDFMEIIDISTLLIKSHYWLVGWLINQIISLLNNFSVGWLTSFLVCGLDG